MRRRDLLARIEVITEDRWKQRTPWWRRMLGSVVEFFTAAFSGQ